MDDSQIPPAMQNGEVNLVNPALASVAFNDAVEEPPEHHHHGDPGLEFQHMDFNESNPYLALADVRHAIAYGTNRAQMVQRIVGPLDPSIKPLQNRIFMPIQPQYQDTSGGYGAFDTSKAKALLKASKMTMGSDGYFHPNFGPEKGQDLTLSISTTSGVPVRAEIEQLFQADMKAIGIKINIQNYNANTLFGTVGPKGEFQIIEFAWVVRRSPRATSPSTAPTPTPRSAGKTGTTTPTRQVDNLFNQAMSTINRARRRQSCTTRSTRSCGRTW